MAHVYEDLKKFKRNYRGGISWRLKSHAAIIEKHLNPGEEVLFVFAGQKNYNPLHWFDTYIIAVTSKRLLIAHKNLLWGYVLSSVTPDLYNDLQIYQGLLWGKLVIDTVKEEIVLTNLPKSALSAIETNISELMMEQKKLYIKKDN